MLAVVQRLVPHERVHRYLRDLDRDYSLLFAPDSTGTSLQAQAHTIISQAGMLGLTRMSECARALENACRSGAGPAAALLDCRAAAGDVQLHAMPAAGTLAG